MNGKTQNYEAVLVRAEKLFNKGNFLLAKREFEKAIRINSVNDFGKKIEVCENELLLAKARDLVKRGRKHLKENKHNKALECFQEANKISPEKWVEDKINQLSEKVKSQVNIGSAKQAEKTGDFKRAAELYQQAFNTEKKEELLLSKAFCLVKAERYEDAVSVYQKLKPLRQVDIYNYGFCKFKTGNYFDCLKEWEKISSDDEKFIKQIEQVRSLLLADLHLRLKNGKDLVEVYRDIKYLLEHSDRPDLKDVMEHSKFAYIEELWNTEEYRKIAELLLPLPQDISFELLQLHAKNSFKLFEKSGEQPDNFFMFWLTSVFCPCLIDHLVSDDNEKEKVQQAMLAEAENMIKNQYASKNGVLNEILAIWNLEKKAVKDLARLVDARQELYHLICTPLFAENFARSKGILELIKENRNFFEDKKHYLETGSMYTVARKSLVFLERGKIDKALESLPSNEFNNEFLNYATQKTRFSFGMDSLKKGAGKCSRYFLSSLDLFDLSPEFEQELVEKATNCQETDELGHYEEVLKQIHKKRSSEQIRKALSLTISKRAIDLFNAEDTNHKVTAKVLRNALSLYPDNDIASRFLKELEPDFEVEAIDKALKQFKLNKAAQIVLDSESEDVEDYFFYFFENILDTLDASGIGTEEKTDLLKRCFECCQMVDDSHYVTELLAEQIQHFED